MDRELNSTIQDHELRSSLRAPARTRGDAGVTSQGARLTVDPPLDLRFKWVGAPYLPSWTGQGSIFGGAGGEQVIYGGVGTPLAAVGCSIPSGTCTWSFVLAPATPGMTTTYETNLVDSLTPGWAAALGSDAVVTALDLEAPAGLYGFSVTRSLMLGGNLSQVHGHAIVAILVDSASPRAILIAER